MRWELNRQLLPAMLAMILAVTASACIMEPLRGVIIINDLGKPVGVYYGDTDTVVGRIDTGATNVYQFDLYEPGRNEHCTTKDIVIRMPDGTQAARIPPPVCESRSRSILLSRYASPSPS
jgi:hypothetical protein